MICMKDFYPPHGFCILSLRISFNAHGSYLMIRSYPDLTAERIKAIYSSHGSLPANCSGVYTVPNMDESRRSQIWSRVATSSQSSPQ
ncbi:hypothetical protein M378DRAFT_168429 [Amanita muscaria Koide BX008]|uniref:Uncharacterized protein n=1 Tax=Amanita muscaria (strain Koide BX008) TaxID=946122 RepID=A0A0C2WUY4_AMAMK|nr:hypothetical protein M378DRAFT_168429 [Amanita muscaria Koide BX008]